MRERCTSRRAALSIGKRSRVETAAAFARRFALSSVCLLVISSAALADVKIRFKIVAQNEQTKQDQPVPGAAVFIDDPTRFEFRSILNATGGEGLTDSELLPAQAWRFVVVTAGYEKYIGDAVITTDGTVVDPTDQIIVENGETILVKTVHLKPRREIVDVEEQLLALDHRDTANTTRRDLEFFRRFPLGAGNPQSLNKVLRSVPGFVENSVNQLHARGEQHGIAVYVDGFLVPPQAQGNLGQFLSPEYFQTFDIKTGGFAPEFGGESGAALNLTPRPTNGVLKKPFAEDNKPFVEAKLSTGAINTDEAYITFHNIRAFPGSPKDADGNPTKTFRYIASVSKRYTDTGAEVPYSSKKILNNGAGTDAVFLKGDLAFSKVNSVSGLFISGDSRTGVANRDSSKDGFLGLQGSSPVLPSQAQLRNDTFQKDNNRFTLLQFKHLLNPGVTNFSEDNYRDIVVSLGATKSSLRLLNNTATGDIRNNPFDSSIEYNPRVIQDYEQFQLQGEVNMRRGDHAIKGGLLFNNYDGDESYQFVPRSQLALNALYTLDPRLVPPGTPLNQTDQNGNQVYQLSKADGQAARSPALNVKREGYYSALYIQDTWKFNNPFTINAGLRYDTYQLKSNTSQTDYTKSEISPRLNMSLLLPSVGPFGFIGRQSAVLRASYNRMFARPELGQGSFIGSAVKPETTDHYEISLERKVARKQTVKAALYTKEIKNYLETTSLLPGSQLTALTTYNVDRASANGFELSYHFAIDRYGRPLSPKEGERDIMTGYLVYANSSTKYINPQQRDTLGRLITSDFVNHDQKDTVSAGVNWYFVNGASMGMNVVYNSGLYSSKSSPGSGREARTEINLMFRTDPKFFNKQMGMEFSIENLLNSNSRINNQGEFEGYRFQQGRRIVASVYGKF